MYVSNNIYNKYVSNKRNINSFEKHGPSVSDVRIIILEKVKTKDENPKNKQPKLRTENSNQSSRKMYVIMSSV